MYIEPKHGGVSGSGSKDYIRENEALMDGIHLGSENSEVNNEM